MASDTITVRDHPETGDAIKQFVFNKDQVFGEASRDVDGFYYFWFVNDPSGAWSAWVFRDIADKLDELNKSWVDHLNEAFKRGEI